MGLQAAHLAGREIGDDHDATAEELFRRVMLGDTGEDLAAREIGAEVDF